MNGLRPRSVCYCAVTAFFLALLFSLPAGASEGDIERAQEHFNAGAELYLEEEYSAAIVRFRQAHELHPHPVFMHNIAMAELRRGRPGHAARAAMEARQMQAELDDREVARNDSIIAGATALSTAGELMEELHDDEEISPATDEPAVVSDASSFGTLGWAGVSGLALGAGALGGAWYVDSQITSHREELQATSGDISEEGLNRQAEQISSWQSRGQVMLFSGIFVTVTGATLVTVELLTGGADDGGIQARLVPSISTPGLRMSMEW